MSLLPIDVSDVLATAGDTHLVGEDCDNRVIDYLVELYKKKTYAGVTSNLHAMGILKREVEKAKRTLSSLQPVLKLNRSRLAMTSPSPLRAKFEESISSGSP